MPALAGIRETMTPRRKPERALSDAVQARMDERGWDVRDVAHRAGLSEATLRKILRGEDERHYEASLKKLSGALDWPPMAASRILRGEPPPDGVAPAEGELEQLAAAAAELRRLADEMATRLERAADLLQRGQ